MKRTFFALALAALSMVACSPKKKALPESVSQQKMDEIYNEVKTPYKYGLIMVPDSNSYKMDCPTIFRHDDQWVMTYIIFDGRGYETHLALSDDLIHWDEQGAIMQFSDTTDWDVNQKAGYPSLIHYDWGGDYGIDTYDGKYWMSYFGGNSTGYEKGLLSVGMAFTKEDPATLHQWDRLKKPVITSNDEDARWYDNSTIYKNFIIEDKERLTGHPFVMYYNARGDSINPDRGAERISMAVSDDMVSWKRFGNKPVLNHHKGITGDAVIQKIGDVYVMFFFRAYWPDGQTVVYNSFAASYDLVHWTEWNGQHLIEPSESYDDLFAHKAYVIQVDGVVYHFYNAVDKLGNRGIALATSKDLGKSSMTFSSTEESAVK
ncbi:glycoside hydrolase family protein [Mangrovibacterium lignilyticum]|uniref:glycosylase n=1 Tax=Mangrovibacterium lignilyticum TaxID=2668052 RepID=UPI0013D7CCBD|nr:glycosylase [Mangrovibacterium lignilyticum]